MATPTSNSMGSQAITPSPATHVRDAGPVRCTKDVVLDLICAGATKAVNTNIDDCYTQFLEQLGPVLNAILYRDHASLEALVEAGADVTVAMDADYDGGYPLEAPPALVLAALCVPGMVQTLLQGNADVNAADRCGTTALMVAAHGGHAQLVELLLTAGAHVAQERTWLYCDTALSLALEEDRWNRKGASSTPDRPLTSERDYERVVRLLLAAGAQVHDSPRAVKPLLSLVSVELLPLLLAAGANVNARTKTGNTPLLSALQAFRFPLALALVAAGADVMVQGADGERRTPLLAAACNAGVVKALLDAGVKPDVASGTGRTPLMAAAGAKELESVKLLLAAGVDVDARDEHGTTALSLAAALCTGFEHVQSQVVTVLLAAGAKWECDALSGYHVSKLLGCSAGELDAVVDALKRGAMQEAEQATAKRVKVGGRT